MTLLSKPTIDDIEAHGYKVLTKSEYERMKHRLEVLERLHRMIHDRRVAERAFDQAGEYGDAEAQSIAFGCIDYFEDEIESVMNELEAMK